MAWGKSFGTALGLYVTAKAVRYVTKKKGVRTMAKKRRKKRRR